VQPVHRKAPREMAREARQSAVRGLRIGMVSDIVFCGSAGVARGGRAAVSGKAGNVTWNGRGAVMGTKSPKRKIGCTPHEGWTEWVTPDRSANDPARFLVASVVATPFVYNRLPTFWPSRSRPKGTDSRRRHNPWTPAEGICSQTVGSSGPSASSIRNVSAADVSTRPQKRAARCRVCRHRWDIRTRRTPSPPQPPARPHPASRRWQQRH